jgi:hypothetical protein
MCPDRQILSVYYDCELPSPWKEKMEAHLAGCPECRARLEKIGGLSAVLREKPVYAAGRSPEEAQLRVWDALASRPDKAAKPAISPAKFRRIWGRSVSIPLPAAVAMAVFFVLTFTIILFKRPMDPDRMPDTAISADMDIDMHGIVPVSNMSEVLQYLGQDNSGTDIMIIRLPETQQFMSTGKPTIIRAADYSRRIGSP